MNHGAMVLIDAIDPVGTVHAQNYEMAGRVYADLERYEDEVGGRFCQDVGIYYSFDSNVDLDGERPGRGRRRLHVRRLLEAAHVAHRPPQRGASRWPGRSSRPICPSAS